MSMEPKLFIAGKAFILHEGKVLILRESSKYSDGTQTGNYDVVGGRLTPGEPFNESLLREIKEETGLDVQIGEPFFLNESFPTVRGEPWHIVRVFVECTVESDDVKLSDDHDDALWIDPRTYKEHRIIDNLHPMFEKYLAR